MTNDNPAPVNRSQRILAYMIAALVLLSLASFLAIIIGTSVGAGADNGFSQGLWPTVIMFPLLGLPFALALTIALLVISAIIRSRHDKRSTS